jgi:hypothetical protein
MREERSSGATYQTLMGVILRTRHAADTTVCVHRPAFLPA